MQHSLKHERQTNSYWTRERRRRQRIGESARNKRPAASELHAHNSDAYTDLLLLTTNGAGAGTGTGTGTPPE